VWPNRRKPAGLQHCEITLSTRGDPVPFGLHGLRARAVGLIGLFDPKPHAKFVPPVLAFTRAWRRPVRGEAGSLQGAGDWSRG
jgi:hypothetical protein